MDSLAACHVLLSPLRARAGAIGALLWAGLALGLSTEARAQAPTKVATVFDVAGADVRALTVSDDETLVAGVTDGGRLVVLDTSSWIAESAAPCDARSVALRGREAGGHYVYVGCEDGFVRTWRWFNDNLGPYTPDGGSDTADTASDGGIESFQIAQNPLMGLWYGGDGYLYGLAEASGNRLNLHDLDPDSGAFDTLAGGPIELFQQGFKEAVLARSGATGDPGTLYIAHGGNDFSTVNLGARTAVNTGLGVIIAITPRDITPAPLLNGTPSGIYIADPDLGVAYYAGGAGAGAAQPIQILDGTLDGLRSLVVTYDSAGTAVESIVVHDNNRVKAFQTLGAGADPLESFEVDHTPSDMVAGPYGYVIAGTTDGGLAVLTARPWVSDLGLSPTVGLAGDEVTLSFSTDEAGRWSIRPNSAGNRTGEVASGEVASAGEQSVTFEVPDSFDEGFNDLYLVFTSADSGLEGTRRVSFQVDNPPDSLVLTANEVGFADGAILLDFDELEAEDIASYRVYIDVEPFTPEDHPTGGPAFTGTDDITAPIDIPAPSESARVTTRIEPLSNYVTYHLAVRATDAAGTEGPMSNVIEAMPRPTFTAAELVGESGGSPCATGPARGALGWLAALGLVGVATRRRRWVGVGVAAVVLGIAPATDALAQDADDETDTTEPADRQRGLSRFERDTTPAWSSFEFRHDFHNLEQEALTSVYNPWVSVFRLEAGPQIFRVFEIDFGVGLMMRKGNKTDVDQAASTEDVRMQWLPLSLGATARIHIIDEQPVVPYAGAGLDWVFWRETELDGDGVPNAGTRLTGSKNGWHWHAGANILLDLFSPKRASMLEATTGINDTWLTIEYRAQDVGDPDEGLSMTGWALSVGLKLDY